MSSRNPLTRVWLLDRTQTLLEDLEEQFRHLEGVLVEPYQSPEEAWERLEKTTPTTVTFPNVLVTDRIGFNTLHVGGHLVEQMRQRYPLSMVLLHSGLGAKHPKEVAQYRKERLIQDYVQKFPVEEPSEVKHGLSAVVETVGNWVKRSQTAFPRRFQQYIIDRKDEASVPLLEDGTGCYLSLIDLYREILLESELGREAEVIWKPILFPKPNGPELAAAS